MTCLKWQNPALWCPTLVLTGDTLTLHFHIDSAWACSASAKSGEKSLVKDCRFVKNKNFSLGKQKKKKRSVARRKFTVWSASEQLDQSGWRLSLEQQSMTAVLESKARNWALPPTSQVRGDPLLMSIFYWYRYFRKKLLSFKEKENSFLPDSTMALGRCCNPAYRPKSFGLGQLLPSPGGCRHLCYS